MRRFVFQYFQIFSREEEAERELSVQLQKIALSIFCLLILVFGWQVWRYTQRGRQIQNDGTAFSEERLAGLVDEVRNRREIVETLVTQLAEDYENGQFNSDDLLQRLKEDALKSPDVAALGIAFEPQLYSQHQKLYAPLFVRDENAFVQLEEQQDYTSFAAARQNQWYLQALVQQTPMWIESPVALHNEHLIVYAVPVFRKAGDSSPKRVQAVVVAGISITDLTEILNRRSLGRLGSAFLLNGEGNFLAHPQSDYVVAGRTLEGLAVARNDDALTDLESLRRRGESGSVKGSLRENSESIHHFIGEVPDSSWQIVMTLFDYEVYEGSTELRQRRAVLAVLGLALLATWTFLAVNAYTLETLPLWKVVVRTSFLCLCTMIYLWWLSLNQSITEDIQAHKTEENSDSILIDTEGELKEFLSEFTQGQTQSEPNSHIHIPTGIQLNAIEFDGSSNLKIRGELWQIFHVNQHKDLPRGVRFVEAAPDPGSVLLEKDFELRREEREIIGWTFSVVLRVDMDYSNYPFDRQRIPLRLQYIDPTKPVILTPDLASYRFLNAVMNPGLRKDLILPGWSQVGTYFSYELSERQPPLGPLSRTVDSGNLDLQYNVIVKRDILTPFLSHVFPIVVVSALLYGVLISSSKSESANTISGFSTFGVLETCGAFFFAIIFVHIDMRSRLNAEFITYMECLHLILYFILLLVAVNSLLFTSTDKYAFIEYEHNLIAKLAFWPTLLILSIVVTFIFFY